MAMATARPAATWARMNPSSRCNRHHAGQRLNCFNNDGTASSRWRSWAASFDVTHINVSTVQLDGMVVKVKGNGSLQFSYQYATQMVSLTW